MDLCSACERELHAPDHQCWWQLSKAQASFGLKGPQGPPQPAAPHQIPAAPTQVLCSPMQRPHTATETTAHSNCITAMLQGLAAQLSAFCCQVPAVLALYGNT